MNIKYAPTSFDKWLLVRYKKFPTKNDVPTLISATMMKTVHDRARVHASIGLMGFAAVGMLINVLIGKYNRKHGRNIYTIQQEKQMEYNKKMEELSKTK